MLIVLVSISRSKVNEIVVLLEIPVEASVGEVELTVKDRSILLVVVLSVLVVVLSVLAVETAVGDSEGLEQLSKKNMLTNNR